MRAVGVDESGGNWCFPAVLCRVKGTGEMKEEMWKGNEQCTVSGLIFFLSDWYLKYYFYNFLLGIDIS